ncbi:unnamed protein product [Rhizopus microsporus]
MQIVRVSIQQVSKFMQSNMAELIEIVITGLLTWPVTRRFGLDKNKSLFSALGASAVGGYVTAKYSYRECENMYGFAQAVETFSNK